MKYKDHSLDFKSDRGIYLVSNLPGTITVEDTNKWEDLYYIDEDGNVNRLFNMQEYCGYINVIDDDHIYPNAVVEFARANDLKIEYLSYVAICQMYIEDSGDFGVPNEFLPTYKDLDKVLVDGNNSTLNINYCETFNLYPEHFTMKMCKESYSKTLEKYSYAMCTRSFGKFKEGEIYRIAYNSYYEDSYIEVLEDNGGRYVISSYYPSVYLNSNDIDYFIMIVNVEISSIDLIKKIFDLLQD